MAAQPVSTGFSNGTSDVNDETDIANEFYGFLCVSRFQHRCHASPLTDNASMQTTVLYVFKTTPGQVVRAN